MNCYSSENKMFRVAIDVCVSRCLFDYHKKENSLKYRSFAICGLSRYLDAIQIECSLYGDQGEKEYMNHKGGFEFLRDGAKKRMSFLCPECPYKFEHMICGKKLFGNVKTNYFEKFGDMSCFVHKREKHVCFLYSPSFLI